MDIINSDMAFKPIPSGPKTDDTYSKQVEKRAIWGKCG